MKTFKIVSIFLVFELLWVYPSVLLNAQSIKIAECKTVTHTAASGNDYPGFWEAVLSFDTTYAAVNKATPEQKSFSELLKALLKGKDAEYINGLKSLFLNTGDTSVRENCYRLLYDEYFYEFQWGKLLDMDSVYFAAKGAVAKDSESVTNDKLYKKLLHSPPTAYSFSEVADTILIYAFAYGTPVIELKVNGKSELFMFDTGAGITSIFSTIADKCKVAPVIPDKIVVGTGTNINVYAQYALCNLKLGNLKVSHSLAMIQDYKAYEAIDKGLPYKINGILGWETIKNLDVEIDYMHSKIIVKKPVKKTHVPANLFYMHVPVVTAYATDGTTLYFGYDTGAGETSLKSGIKKKVKFDNLKQGKIQAGSAGGFEAVNVETVKGYSLCLNNLNFTFDKLYIDDHNVASMNLDGHFGGDIAQFGSIYFDYTNKFFEIKNNKIHEK